MNPPKNFPLTFPSVGKFRQLNYTRVTRSDLGFFLNPGPYPESLTDDEFIVVPGPLINHFNLVSFQIECFLMKNNSNSVFLCFDFWILSHWLFCGSGELERAPFWLVDIYDSSRITHFGQVNEMNFIDENFWVLTTRWHIEEIWKWNVDSNDEDESAMGQGYTDYPVPEIDLSEMVRGSLQWVVNHHLWPIDSDS